MSVCNPFRDAEIDSDTSATASILNRADILSIGYDNDALLSVLGQCPNLLQWSVAFGPVLWS